MEAQSHGTIDREKRAEMERLTGLDAMFLYAETPTQHLHVVGVVVMDPSTVPGGYSFENFKTLIESRLEHMKPFRRRVKSVPFDLAHPLWIEDPDFDIDLHLHRIAAPSPGGPHELSDIASDIAGRPLDRTRPLWELWVIEGLEHGHIAMVAKVHHAAIDGVSGADLMVYLFDLEPKAVEPNLEDPWQPDRVPNDVEMFVHAGRSWVQRPVQLARLVPKAVGSTFSIVRRRRSGAGGMATPFTAPSTPWNTAISAQRSIAFASVPLDEVKAVKKAFGTTVNDVVLAITTGAVRRYLESHGQLSDKPLVSVVPISVRAEGRAGANQLSALFTYLPTHLDDPVERLEAISTHTRGAKEEHGALGADVLMDLAEFAPPRLTTRAMDFYSRMNLADRHPPIHNLVISNVPGPDIPLYCGGARVVAIYPLGPVFEGAGLNVTVLSYMGSVDFGFIAARDGVPDVWALADSVEPALLELTKAAG
jgi:WS/DGAT/MGAT family acyltransferase